MSERRIIPLPFISAGVDTGKDARLGVQWTRLQNAIVEQRGAIRKRAGRTRTTATTVQDAIEARQIAQYGDTPVLVGNRGLASIAGPDDIRLADEYSDGVDDDLIGSLAVQRIWGRPGKHLDLAITDSYYVAVMSQERAYGSYGSGWVLVCDLDTGDVRHSLEVDDLAGSEARIRAVTIGDEVHVYYAALDGSDRYIAHVSVDSDGAITDHGIILALDLGSTSADCVFDAAGLDIGGSPGVAIARRNSAGDIYVARSYDGATFTSSAVATSGTYSPAVAIWRRADDLVDVAHLADVGGTHWSLIVESWDVDALTQDATPGTIDTWSKNDYSPEVPTAMGGVAAVRSGSGTTLLVCRRYAALPGYYKYPVIEEYQLDTTSGAVARTLKRTLYGCMLTSRPVAYGADGFVFGVHSRAWLDVEQETVADVFVWLAAGQRDTYRPVAKADQGRAKWDWGTGNGSKPYTDQPSSIVADSAGVLHAIGTLTVSRPPNAGRYNTTEGGWTSRSALTRYSMDFSSDELQHCSADGLLYLAGAMPRHYDGAYVFEQGFLTYPARCRMATADSTGQTSSYVATYEHVDASGSRHQSIPSTVPVSRIGTVGGEGTGVDVDIPTLQITARRGVRIVLWRSVDGGPYQRVDDAENDPSVPYVTINDTKTSNEGEASESLYTNGNLLEHDQPPAYGASEIYDSRLWIAPYDAEGRELWMSRRRVAHHPRAMNAVLLIDVPEDGGQITSLRRIGERLLIQKRDRTYATWGGPGPDDIGSGPTYQQPYQLSLAAGCVAARSAIEAEGGVYALASDQIYRIGGGGDAQPIGDAARWYSSALSITQAARSPRTEICWQTSDGEAIVYDWLRGEWRTWTGYQGVAIGRDVDGIVTLAADGHVWHDSAAVYADNGAHYSMLLETGWIPLGQIGGFGHLIDVLLIGYFAEDCGLRVRWAWNGDPVWSASYDIDLTSSLEPFGPGEAYGTGLLSATYNDQAMLLRVRPPRSRAAMVRMQISDIESGSADSSGIVLSAMALRVSARRGIYPVDGSRRI